MKEATKAFLSKDIAWNVENIVTIMNIFPATKFEDSVLKIMRDKETKVFGLCRYSPNLKLELV